MSHFSCKSLAIQYRPAPSPLHGDRSGNGWRARLPVFPASYRVCPDTLDVIRRWTLKDQSSMLCCGLRGSASGYVLPYMRVAAPAV